MLNHLSPLRYPGGKAAIAPLLADILRRNDLHDGVLVEPFAGGAGASLYLLISEYVREVILNDADEHIVLFWEAVLNQTKTLAKKIEDASVDISTWEKCRDIYSDEPRKHKKTDVAFATFFLNRCNRSGIICGAGPIGGRAQVGRWKLDARFNRKELSERIRRISFYSDRLTVRGENAFDLLSDFSSIPSGSVVFLDPPYYNKGQQLYLNKMDHDDHVELASLLASSPDFFWVLTYDNTPEISELYKDFHPREFELRYSARSNRLGRELLILDPRLDVPDTLLKRHHQSGRLSFC